MVEMELQTPVVVEVDMVKQVIVYVEVMVVQV
jgi:hypothetical protein